MLFSQPNTLVYIQRSGVLLAGKHTAPSRLDFPEATVKNMEIVQREKLRQTYTDWFRNADVRGKRIIVVLDPSIVFEKTIQLDQSGQPDVLMHGFIDAMPFNPNQRVCVTLETGTDLQLFATNADLYQVVIEALRAADAGKVVAVTPSAAYHLTNEERTISTASERFFADKTISHSVNFLEARVV